MRFRRRSSEQPAELPVRHLESGEPAVLRVPRYRPSTQGRRTVALPTAYAVPLAQHALRDLLQRQGYRSYAAGLLEWYTVEERRFEPRRELPGSTPAARASRDPHWRTVRYERRLEHFVLFPVEPDGGRLLALMLEAESAYAIHRHASRAVFTVSGGAYPLLRVL